ncbi:hypothetical protein ACS0TY_003969 [Phlomoides rotata]
MEKAILFVWVLVLLTIAPVHSGYYTSQPHVPPKLKKTHLRFFVHDILSGTKPSAVQIAGNKPTPNNPTPFGSLFAIDDLLTEGPQITSKVIGTAQGLYVSSSQGKDLTLILYVDLGFTTGMFNGSSLSVFSRNPVSEGGRRELAVVGGRGKFRYAQGAVFVTTNYLNVTNGDAVLEYNVEVIHP